MALDVLEIVLLSELSLTIFLTFEQGLDQQVIAMSPVCGTDKKESYQERERSLMII